MATKAWNDAVKAQRKNLGLGTGVRKFVTGATRDVAENKPEYHGFLAPEVLVKVDDWVLRERDLAWAGGLFEGEGYIGFHQNKPQLQVKMTDEDTLRRFAMIMGRGKVYGPYQVKETADHKQKSPWRPYFSWQCRADDAVLCARLLFPYLQTRRQATLVKKWGAGRLARVCGMNHLALQRFGGYMMQHQKLFDGSKRASNNWKAGIPLDSYLASMWRHLFDVSLHHDGHGDHARENLEDALCAVLFNVQGYLYEVLKAKESKRDS